MKLALPRAMMTIAIGCLGDRRRDWALAMEAEFEVAVDEGQQMAFAAGCLMAAWGEMHRDPDGRLTLTSYALGLGLIVPTAGLNLAHVIEFLLAGTGMPGGAVLAAASTNPVLEWAQVSALPAQILLWVSLCFGQLCLAWLLLDRDWLRVLKVCAAVGAATVTLFLLMAVLLLDADVLISQVSLLAVEFLIVAMAARWHARLVSSSPPSTV